MKLCRRGEGVGFWGVSKTFLSLPVCARLLIFTVTVVARWLLFKATMELKRLGWMGLGHIAMLQGPVWVNVWAQSAAYFGEMIGV